jgi:integrase-like protein
MSPVVRHTPAIRATPNGKWQARYRDSSGRQRGKTFERKTDARTFLATVKADMARGSWVDPGQTNTRLGPYAERWFASRLNLRRSTSQTDEGILRRHVLPAFGDARMGRITRGDVQLWVKGPQRSRARTGVGPAVPSDAARDPCRGRG